ncbi:MAG: hypothetical protein R8J85_07115 [Mariprofundales bacterium]
MDNDKEQVPVPSVWKRQMKMSGFAIIIGLILLMYAIPQLRHAGGEHLSTGLVVLSVIGGLAVLGGAFSYALALFFHLWHQKSED